MIFWIMLACTIMFVSIVLGGYVLCLGVLSWWEQRTNKVFVVHNGEHMSLKRWLDKLGK